MTNKPGTDSSDSVLIYADTLRSPEMRREVPYGVKDPFLFIEHHGSRYAVVRALEIQRMREVPSIEAFVEEDFGLDLFSTRGLSGAELHYAVALEACRHLGVTRARTPQDFPVALADVLRRGGITISPESEVFAARQRVKSTEQIAGIRRAQRAAEAAVTAIADALSKTTIGEDAVLYDGEPLTCERLKQLARIAIAEAEASIEDFIVAHGAQTCIGHHAGSGAILPGEPITVDLSPCDPATGCLTDMTRTFVVGRISDELKTYHDLSSEALRAVQSEMGPGVLGADLHAIAAAIFEQAGYPTLRTKSAGEVLLDGFFHSLGHGVGLRVHEPPHLDASGGPLVAGEVIAIEPGCYRQGYGGVRLEDVLLITSTGAELLTDFPYALQP